MFRAPVSRYMTPDPVSCRPEASLEEIAEGLARHHISAMPVVDERGCAVGVVSRRDLLRVGALEPADNAHVRVWKLPDLTAFEVMTDRVLAVPASTSVREAAAVLLDHHVHRVLVEKDRQLVGVLSTQDVMRAIVDARYRAPIHRFMSSPAETIAAFEPVSAARAQLESLRVRGLVVAEDGWPIGVFAEEDALASRDRDATTPVEHVMGHELLIQGPDVAAYRAAARMASMRARRIVVVENATVQGVLTGFDLAGAAASA